MEDFFEKASRTHGETHSNGKWYWNSNAKQGQGDWRVIPKSGKIPEADGGGSGAKKTVSTPSDTAHQEVKPATKVTNNQQVDTKTEEDKPLYNPPKANVKYNIGPKVKVDVPETWKIKKKDGRIDDAHRDKLMTLYESKDDDWIINRVNGKNLSKYYRQLAFDVAANRGIDESKLDPSGTLQKFWDSEEKLYNMTKKKSVSNDGGEEDYDDQLRGFDPEEFMKEFPGGDTGWQYKTDKRVKKAFNNLDTLVDRQKYDAFLDYQKRLSTDYLTPIETVQDLNADYLTFMMTDISPLFISAGGAGVGKTYGFKVLSEELGYVPLSEGQDPEDGDWTYVQLSNPKSDKEFFQMLKKYNGSDSNGNKHILLFDDADDILTSKRFQSTMKTIADTDPKSRFFKDPDGTGMLEFTAKIMVITNKDTDNLISRAGSEGEEDVKAILSRAAKSEINLTVNENLEILKDRYETMGVDGLKISGEDEKKARKEVYDFILENRDQLDPAKFTVRKFRDVLIEVQSDIIRQSMSKKSSRIADIVGTGRGWKAKALRTLNKSNFDELNWNDSSFFEKAGEKKIPKEVKKKMEEIKKKNPSRFKELFGERALDTLLGGENDEEVKKSFIDEIGDISLEEAEDILLGNI